MKCWSRSTLGVIVGILNIVVYSVVSIIIMRSLVEINNLRADNAKFDSDLSKTAISLGNSILFTTLIICLVMVILSVLLIRGIVKRRHELMVPWLVISAIGFICSVLRLIEVPFFIGCIIFGLQFLVLYKIYTLYKDIRAKYHERPLQIFTGVGGQMGFHNNHSIKENGFETFNGVNVVSAKY